MQTQYSEQERDI